MSVDCAFAPGFTPFDNDGRQLYESRPNTRLVERFDIIHLKWILDFQMFIEKIVNDPFITKPMGDIFIHSHGTDSGWMDIDLDHTYISKDGKEAKNTNYNVVDAAAKGKYVQIPDVLHSKPPDPPIPFDVHIRGCSIGKSPAFVRKLKEAFNSPRFVTAPLHAHHPDIYDFGDEHGAYEYLEYAFEIVRPSSKKFQTLQQAVKAFQEKLVYDDNQAAQKFTFIAGEFGVEDPVPDQLWDEMITNNLKSDKMILPEFELRSGVKHIKLGVNLGENIGQKLTELERYYEFEHKVRPLGPFTVPGITQNPGSKSQMVTVFSDYISSLDEFIQSATNLFPIYMQLGYNRLQDFIDGYTWDCTWTGSEISCTGSRDIYAIFVPIVEVAGPHKDELFFNFYPIGNSKLKLYESLSHTDARLFLSV